jgi:transcriptional regulator with XRE-family HTH domain/quercetin dioxygenase-like cupin family protein
MDLPTREAVDAATASIGARLAATRARNGMRVSELARRAGVSSSLISQIERGSSKPSVGTLFAIAQVLGVPVDLFFTDGNEGSAEAPPAGEADGKERSAEAPPAGEADRASADPGPSIRERNVVDGTHLLWDESRRSNQAVVRAAERAALDIRGGVRWERLTPTAIDGVEFLELVYSPGAESDRQVYRHPGIELVLVTQGTMTIFVGFDQHDLRPGDSIAFPSSMPHRYVNLTDGETRAITVILRDDLSQMPIRDRTEPARPTEAGEA